MGSSDLDLKCDSYNKPLLLTLPIKWTPSIRATISIIDIFILV